MAFRRRFSGYRPRFSGRGNKQQVPRWTAQSAEQLLTAAIPNQAVILYTPATTIGTGTYEEESKIVRVVGRLCVVADTATVLSGPVGMGIIKRGANLGAPAVGGGYDPLIANELAQRDWLGVYNVQVPPNAGPQAWSHVQELDIKVQRRIRAEERLELMLMNGVGDDVTVTIDIRILIVIRM